MKKVLVASQVDEIAKTFLIQQGFCSYTKKMDDFYSVRKMKI